MRPRVQTTTSLMLSALLNLALIYAVGSTIVQAPQILRRIEVDLQSPPARVPLQPRPPPPHSVVPTVAAALPLPQMPAVPKVAQRPELTRPNAPPVRPRPVPLRVPAAPPVPVAVPLRLAIPAPASSAAVEPAQASIAQTPPVAVRAEAESRQVLDAYFAQVRARIEAAKRYPRWARRAYLQGKTTVSFGLHPDGKLQNVTVTTSSGNEALDREALRAVEGGAPYPPFPGEPATLPESFAVTVVFRLQ